MPGTVWLTGVWSARFEYRTGKMNPRKIELLENLGFHWDLHRAKWFHMLEELKQFKARQGHCNVPQRVPEVARLSVWVSTQRLNFKKGRMSKERFLILENLGFDWAPHETKRLRRRQQRELSIGTEQSGFVLPTGTDFYL